MGSMQPPRQHAAVALRRTVEPAASRIGDAARRYKGSEPNERAPYASAKGSLEVIDGDDERLEVPAAMMKRLQAEAGDLMYVSDARWWLGGFRSLRASAEISEGNKVRVSHGSLGR